ncbi:MAG: O-antigen polysaccharide polymerase Wzy, partial [Planctomycetota bacterium]
LGRGLGPLQLGMPIMIVGCLWIEASALPRATKNLFLPVALAICVWSVAFISVRTNAVVLVVGYLAILARRHHFELRSIRPWMVASALVLYASLESFALLRGVYRGDLSQALARLEAQGEMVFAAAVGGSELSHPFITTGEVLREREAGELAGQSILDGVAACLPRGLYPDRPLYLSEQFVRSNYAELADRGGGAAFSLVAESWLNFGSLVGPLVFGLALGLLLAWCERRRERVPDGIVARLLPYFTFYVAMQHRNEFGTLFKQVFMIGLVVVPLALVAETLAVALRGARIGAGRRVA